MRELRLLIAEWLLGKALAIMPDGKEKAALADLIIKYSEVIINEKTKS